MGILSQLTFYAPLGKWKSAKSFSAKVAATHQAWVKAGVIPLVALVCLLISGLRVPGGKPETLLNVLLTLTNAFIPRLKSRAFCCFDRNNWIAMVVLSVLLAFSHLFAIIPLAMMWLYLIYQYRFASIKYALFTFVLSSPLLLLFKAMWDWRIQGRSGMLDWYGAPINQLIIFAPLEFFSYCFVFWIPMVLYATWVYRRVKEVVLLIGISLATYATLLLVCEVTPVFLRYLLLFVPMWCTIGLIPVAAFIESNEHTRAQKAFVVGAFGAFYFAIVAFGFVSGLYQFTGTYYP